MDGKMDFPIFYFRMPLNWDVFPQLLLTFCCGLSVSGRSYGEAGYKGQVSCKIGPLLMHHLVNHAAISSRTLRTLSISSSVW